MQPRHECCKAQRKAPPRLARTLLCWGCTGGVQGVGGTALVDEQRSPRPVLMISCRMSRAVCKVAKQDHYEVARDDEEALKTQGGQHEGVEEDRCKRRPDTSQLLIKLAACQEAQAAQSEDSSYARENDGDDLAYIAAGAQGSQDCGWQCQAGGKHHANEGGEAVATQGHAARSPERIAVLCTIHLCFSRALNFRLSDEEGGADTTVLRHRGQSQHDEAAIAEHEAQQDPSRNHVVEHVEVYDHGQESPDHTDEDVALEENAIPQAREHQWHQPIHGHCVEQSGLRQEGNEDH
mmetsp:Transcript_67460/g.140975  ORF Transcript_67460/g.140975 Transcript_67460/m.140975 type:complete len:293 (-) Transcript_67460:1004-1882(-)